MRIHHHTVYIDHITVVIHHSAVHHRIGNGIAVIAHNRTMNSACHNFVAIIVHQDNMHDEITQPQGFQGDGVLW